MTGCDGECRVSDVEEKISTSRISKGHGAEVVPALNEPVCPTTVPDKVQQILDSFGITCVKDFIRSSSRNAIKNAFADAGIKFCLGCMFLRNTDKTMNQ